MMNTEMLILVDELDQEIGVMEKYETHQKGLLHRAFSVLVFDEQNNLIIQQRSSDKYHSAMLWTNTCCGHPRPNEEIKAAAKRRLMEEMGFECDLEFLYKFQYETQFDNSLMEKEIDHVFVGIFKGEPIPNSKEVHAWKKESMQNVVLDVEINPLQYTTWFRYILQEKTKILSYLNSQ